MPIITPTIIANENVFITSPPTKNKIKTTRNVVKEVMIVLLKDSLMLWFMTDLILDPLSPFTFSLTLSNITIVSLRE